MIVVVAVRGCVLAGEVEVEDEGLERETSRSMKEVRRWEPFSTRKWKEKRRRETSRWFASSADWCSGGGAAVGDRSSRWLLREGVLLILFLFVNFVFVFISMLLGSLMRACCGGLVLQNNLI